MKKSTIALALAACCCVAYAVDPTYYGSSGVSIDEGKLYLRDSSGVDHAVTLTGAQVNSAVCSTSGGVKIADGVSSTTAGSVTVATGLTTVVGALGTLIQDPTLSCSKVTAYKSATAGSIVLKVWGVTNTHDATPINDTITSRSVSWHAWGT